MIFNAAMPQQEWEMDMIQMIVAALLGVAVGAWGYRYWLRRDPATLEALAAQIRAARRGMG